MNKFKFDTGLQRKNKRHRQKELDSTTKSYVYKMMAFNEPDLELYTWAIRARLCCVVVVTPNAGIRRNTS